jgi:hypothetical protein
MESIMSEYKYPQVNRETYIIRTRDGAVIPFDPSNSDYRTFLEWKGIDGNIPDPPDPLPPLDPQEVEARVIYTDLQTKYQDTIVSLQNIEKNLATIKNNANDLSTINISGTPAPAFLQIQTALRKLGTDLSTLVTDVNTLTIENEQLLKVVGTYISRILR